jgi:hypothetical protein
VRSGFRVKSSRFRGQVSSPIGEFNPKLGFMVFTFGFTQAYFSS